ncbi:MAG: pyridoxal phosphate-dependent aminotransferase [Candidatus Altiarchaeota archaeon]|nr:pyridoxal phosphate-dependent aminotransferase [Candidatus Altiarchaeota archaeon]
MMLAKRVLDVPPSATFKYAALAKKEGVINLTVGRPDFDTPKCIKEAAKKALDEGKVHYTPGKGIPELRAKIAEKLAKENGLKNIDDGKVIVSMGAKNILYEIFMTMIDEGDVVALPNPSWVSYESMVKLAGGNVAWLPLKPDNGFVPDDDFLAALDRSKAKIVVINSPNNPTGAVYPESVLKKIIKVAEANDIWLISDECYEKMIYEGAHFSPGSAYPKTITVNAFSKQFSMTGWRLGYAACEEFEIIDKMSVIQEQSVSNPVSFAQYGALACFTLEAEKDSKIMMRELQKRRDYVMERMKEINAVCKKPNGAFYIFPYFDGHDDVELANALLEAGVGTVPGSPFGTNGRGCLRISYGSGNIKVLGGAFDRMKTVKGLSK